MKTPVIVLCVIAVLFVSSCATIHAYQSGREYLEAEELMLNHEYRAALENYQRAFDRSVNNGHRRSLLQAKIKICEARVARIKEIEGKRDRALKNARHAVALEQYQILLDEQLVPDRERDDFKGIIKDLKRRINRHALKRSAAKARTVDGLLKEGDDLAAEGAVLDALARYEAARDAAPKDPRPRERIASIEEAVIAELEVQRMSVMESLVEPLTEENVDAIVAKLQEILSVYYHPATKKSLQEVLEKAWLHFKAAAKYRVAHKYLAIQIKNAPKRQHAELKQQLADLRDLCNATEGKNTCR